MVDFLTQPVYKYIVFSLGHDINILHISYSSLIM